MERAFDAVASGNPDDMRAIQLAEGTSISFRPHRDGKPVVKIDGSWTIANWMWTVEKDGCPGGESGLDDAAP